MAGLKINNVSKSFAGFNALTNVSLDVRDGEFVAILGPSGCGKTTLLRLIAGFEKVTEGTVTVDGNLMSSPSINIPPESRRVGIVFQNYALWPHMTVSENVGYSLKVAKVHKTERHRRIEEALALVDLKGFGDRRPSNLSGGQRQRVALARCLVSAPSLVLFDEPLANLDVHLRASMEDEFASFHKRTGTTIVYITHDQAEAMALADRIAVMDKGILVQFATPRELYEQPATEMVASFIAQGMVFPIEILSAQNGKCRARMLGHDVQLRCSSDQKVIAPANACIRSADIELVETGGIPIEIQRCIYRGGGARIEARPLDGSDLELHFDLPEPKRLKAGDRIQIRVISGWVIPQEYVS
ncbi:ABC transporter ATP-binding protein [Phyllobacterium pellucidum]|uniref:ABC transporter ATP-binding protein n=1 Tax=Phyllobacterium pellucidum TaxID=2740464 RepID=UPI001D155022|nr:ABC transporter ATP-binding protein [Phyllobacterium sp. T1018]UGY11462.1 ABC transporter ATP-binding protein [Phyllobacterium sp. T1018]